MANYIASWRTNYFRVKDYETYLEEVDRHYGPEVEHVKDSEGRVGLIANEMGEDYGIPSAEQMAGPNETSTPELVDLVASHLAPGQVAIFREIGQEKLRYLNGFAVAVNGEGEREEISLDEIYRLAQRLGTEVTVAEY